MSQEMPNLRPAKPNAFEKIQSFESLVTNELGKALVRKDAESVESPKELPQNLLYSTALDEIIPDIVAKGKEFYPQWTDAQIAFEAKKIAEDLMEKEIEMRKKESN
jgi:hypothetical protein